ncbi:MAG TPA: UbiD family decarboxylase [Firmicutes bacterium]|jgi:2,5-furandicarboxylate decarboxylase 1|nr:UbiD family decarboxylase [Bacillota bacterium]
MGFKDLRDYVNYLRKHRQLLDVDQPLSPRFEVGAALRYLDQRSPNAVYFSNVTGFSCPVVGNLLGSYDRIALAMGVETGELLSEFNSRSGKTIDPLLVKESPVEEVVHQHQKGQEINLAGILPVLTHHARDIGPYMTSALLVSADPENGHRGMGIHRILLKGGNKVGIYIYNPPIRTFLDKAEAMGKPLDIAIVSGVDPALFLSSIVYMKDGQDKFAVAGSIKGEPVELFACGEAGLQVPARAEFVLLGQIQPGIREEEGPFGESSGYYLTYQNPVAQIHTVMHRRDPLYHALMPFNRENNLLLNLTWESTVGQDLEKKIPYLTAFRLCSVMGMCALLQIKKTAEGQPKEIMEYVLKTNPLIKGAIVVDTDVDLASWDDVSWAVSTRFQPHRDLLLLRDQQGYPLDPSTRDVITSKWGMDATAPLGEKDLFEKVVVPAEVMEKVNAMLKGINLV